VASVTVLRAIAWYSIEKDIMVNREVLVPLISLIKSPELDMVRTVVKALSNVVLDEHDLHSRTVGEGVIDPLLDLILKPDISVSISMKC